MLSIRLISSFGGGGGGGGSGVCRSFIFQHNAKAGLLPRLCPAFAPPLHAKSPLTCLSIQNEAISLVAMRSNEL